MKLSAACPAIVANEGGSDVSLHMRLPPSSRYSVTMAGQVAESWVLKASIKNFMFLNEH